MFDGRTTLLIVQTYVEGSNDIGCIRKMMHKHVKLDYRKNRR